MYETVVHKQASIVFDVNVLMDTNPVVNAVGERYSIYLPVVMRQ